MENKDYSKRETDMLYNDFEKQINDMWSYMKKEFAEMKERQDVTNDRVSWTEKMIWMALGGIGVIGLISTVLSVATFFL